MTGNLGCESVWKALQLYFTCIAVAVRATEVGNEMLRREYLLKL